MTKQGSIAFFWLFAFLLVFILVSCGAEGVDETPVEVTPEEEATAVTDEAESEESQTPEALGLTAVIVSGDSAGTGKPFTFDATQSQAGDAEIVNYVWSMGDGTTLFGISVEHAYGEPGFYTVNLIVTDEKGQTDTAAKVVEVIDSDEDPTPTAAGESALIGSSWILSNSMRGTTVTLVFHEEELSGSTGCNDYVASYTTIDSGDPVVSITVSSISIDKNLCTAEVMAQEKGYLESLGSADNYIVDETLLILETGKGTLTFKLDTD
jgi:heat shock protein HslJ